MGAAGIMKPEIVKEGLSMKKIVWLVIGLVVLAAAVGGVYYAMTRPANNASTKSSNKSSSSQSSSQSSTSDTTAILQTKTDASLGQYLADKNGRALYTYDLDAAGVSNCTGQCLVDWPAYVAATTTNLPANVTVITRSDGGKQYAYKGMPLYTFISDVGGHVTGDGVGSFHVAKP